MSVRTDIVSLLDVDPELGDGLPAAEWSSARAMALGEPRRMNSGPWDPDDPRSAAMLVVSGLIARQLGLGGRVAAELLGPGDVLDVYALPGDLLPGRVTWRVLSRRAEVIVVSADRLSQMPPVVIANLLHRAVLRGSRLATAQAIAQLPAIDDRLVALFAHLAERWGQVTARGIRLPLSLTHETIGQLLGAARPTVSLALKSLAAQRVVVPCEGGWLFPTTAPDRLRPRPVVDMPFAPAMPRRGAPRPMREAAVGVQA